MGQKIRPPATCHPDRPHWARGMCTSCYQTWWREENPERYAERLKNQRRATCHPERPVLARGLCSSCYRAERRKEPEYKDREREWGRKYQRAKSATRTPAERKHAALMSQYRMSLEEWHARLLSQDGRCGGCNEPMPAPHVDHCHSTGAVRGLLCNACNSAIGYAKDDVDRLRGLIDYLLASRRTSLPVQSRL
jgi:hypothetical protein